MTEHPTHIGAVSVGALAAAGHYAHMVEPWLADASYIAAIIVACITIYQKFRSK